MKKLMIMGILACMVCCMTLTVRTDAKQKKNSVHYELKKGTLTIRGKGKMPGSMIFKENKKIKKVIVKKGVTEVSDNAFCNCKKLIVVKLPNGLKKIGRHSFDGTKLKKVVIPKSVKTVGVGAFYNCKKLSEITMPGKLNVPRLLPDEEIPTFLRYVKTIKFSTTPTFDLVCRLKSDKLIVSKKDKKYQSIDGVIYTKDGKETAFLPARKKITLAGGCTTFTLQSLLYNTYIGEDMYLSPGEDIQEIVFPKSLEKISHDGIKLLDTVLFYSYKIKKIIVKNKQIDKNQIKNFTDIIKGTYKESETEDNVIEISAENYEAA